jgi:hypothetical protein
VRHACRHCELSEAIQKLVPKILDCFVALRALTMTVDEITKTHHALPKSSFTEADGAGVPRYLVIRHQSIRSI